MKHHHNEPQGIDEATLAMKRYWQMPRVYQFSSTVKEVYEEKIRLEENFFYPEGGGQPADKGNLHISDTMTFDVIDVQEDQDAVWLYVPNHRLEEGMNVDAIIDQYRRETLTRNHSAQHLLSAVLWDEFELDTTRAAIDLEETEIELDQNPTIDQLNNSLMMVDEYISANLPINSSYYSNEEILNLKIRGGVMDDHSVIRLVEIGSIDMNPCGGTHLEQTDSIETVAIRRIDGKRIKFITGQQARQFYLDQLMTNQQIAKSIGVPLQSVQEEVERLYSQNKKFQKQIMDLENDLLSTQLRSGELVIDEEIKFYLYKVMKLERGVILDSVGDLDENMLILVRDNSNGFIIVSGDKKIMDDLMDYLRSQHIIQGGGRGTTMMGKVLPDKSLKDNIVNFLHSRS